MPQKTGIHRKYRRFFIGGSDGRILKGAEEATRDHIPGRPRHCVEKARQAEWADPQNPTPNLNQPWYAAITGGMPLRWYIVAVCYWTIVILLGSYPWNILLMLLSLPAMDVPRRDQTDRCWPRCPVDTGYHNER